MPHHLFLFTIGPVQGFIAQAKRTHDLYSGSKLLTALCMAGMNALPESWKPVFPNYDGKKSLKEASFPNRFIAHQENENIESATLQKMGEDIEIAVRAKWLEIQQDVWKKHKITPPEGAQAQLNSQLEIYWLFTTADNYIDAYQSIESTMGSIKNVRQFSQLSEMGRKCMLDGERNVMLYNPGQGVKIDYEKLKFKLPQINNIALLPFINPAKLRPDEGLSAVSFVKRCFEVEKNAEFASTAEIALGFSFKELEKDKMWEKLHDRFRDDLLAIKDTQNNNISSKILLKNEWQLYYEENLSRQYFEKNYGVFCNEDAFRESKEALKKLRDSAKEKGFRFSSYYAVILFDGDGMGEWFSGKSNENTSFISDNKLKDYHTALSESLQNFSHVAKMISNNMQGEVVYCGGDDFLGFCNIENLLPFLSELRAHFTTTIMEGIDAYLGKEKGEISFSCGVAIAHYKAPLSEALNKARELESKAKKVKEKDALAMGVMKHSGEIEEAVFKFDTDENNNSTLISNITAILAQLQEGKFSNAFIHKLCQEFQLFKDKKEDIKIVKPEVKRLIQRSLNKNTGADEAKMLKNVSYLLDKNLVQEKELENFLNMLSVCDFLLRNGSKPKKSVSATAAQS